MVPAFRAARDLEVVLPAIHREVADSTEVIVVDDGSPDDTAATAARHGARVVSQPNRGPAAARNLGARAARGDILIFLDSDCEVTPGWFAALTSPLVERRADAVKGAYVTTQREPVARLCQLEFEERYDMLRQRIHTDFVDSYSMAIGRTLFLEAGGFDESFRRADNEDVDFSFRLARMGRKLAFAPDARVRHRHPDSLGRYFRLKLSRGYHRAKVYERYPGKALRDSYTPATLKGQVLGSLLIMAGAALTPVAMIPGAATVALASAMSGLLLLSGCSLPFALRVARRDARLLHWLPAFLTARSAALGLGVLARALHVPPPQSKRR